MHINVSNLYVLEHWCKNQGDRGGGGGGGGNLATIRNNLDV